MSPPFTMRTTLLLLGLLLIGCEAEDSPDVNPLGEPEFSTDGTLEFVRPDGSVIKTIDVEIAENEAARTTGLMFRRKMTLNQGMLFLFSEEADRGFWMKNTPIPLDILFVDADSQVVNIVKRTRPLSEDRVTSAGPARFVVEVRGGFSDRYGLTDSTRIRWRRD